jgi:hypothetical protein
MDAAAIAWRDEALQKLQCAKTSLDVEPFRLTDEQLTWLKQCIARTEQRIKTVDPQALAEVLNKKSELEALMQEVQAKLDKQMGAFVKCEESLNKLFASFASRR